MLEELAAALAAGVAAAPSQLQALFLLEQDETRTQSSVVQEAFAC